MIRRIWAVIRKELLLITRDKIMMIVAFVAPLVLTVLFGFLYIQHSVNGIPIVILDQDQSEISRMIVRAFKDSEKFQLIHTADSFAELEKAVASERAYMGVVIPPDVSSNVKQGRSSQVGIILNGSNLLIMNTAANAANQVVQTLSGGITIKIMQGFGISEAKAYQAVTALAFRTRVWYNPTTSYVTFMVLGLLGTVLQQVTFLGVALSFVKEREDQTWKHLIGSQLRWWELIAGKFIVYFTIYTMNALVMFTLAIHCFGMPMRGDAGLLLVALLLFIAAMIGIGMVISVLTPSAAQALEISMLIAVPSFLISGYTWPAMSMPVLIQWLSKLLPLTHFLKVARSVVLMGNGWELVWPGLGVLVVFSLMTLPIVMTVVKYRMAKV